MGFFPALGDVDRIELLEVPGQQALLRAIGAETRDGRWAYRVLAAFAGRRWGKTQVCALAAIDRLRRPGLQGWASAASYDDLHDFVAPAICRFLPRSWVAPDGIDAQHRTIRTRVGSWVAFRSLDDPDKPRGPGLDWWWIDEARKVSLRAYETGRPMLADRQGQLWATTTPNGFDWCYEQLWVPAQQGVPGFWAIRSKTVENPLPGLREEVESARRTMDPRLFAQEYEADFVTFAGAVYGDAVLVQSLPDDEALRDVLRQWPTLDPSWPAFVGLDPGTDHPFAAVVAVLTPIGLVAVGEYEERDRPIQEHRLGLLRMVEQAGVSLGQVEAWVMDRTQRQWFHELALGSWPIHAEPSEGDLMTGINRVKAWLYARQLWFIRSRTPRLLERLGQYRYAENVTRDDIQRPIERVVKRRDDLCDALRYLVMRVPFAEPEETTSQPARGQAPIPAGHEWEFERMRRLEPAGPSAAGPEDYLGPDAPEAEAATDEFLEWLRGGAGGDLLWEDNPVGQFW